MVALSSFVNPWKTIPGDHHPGEKLHHSSTHIGRMSWVWVRTHPVQVVIPAALVDTVDNEAYLLPSVVVGGTTGWWIDVADATPCIVEVDSS